MHGYVHRFIEEKLHASGNSCMKYTVPKLHSLQPGGHLACTTGSGAALNSTAECAAGGSNQNFAILHFPVYTFVPMHFVSNHEIPPRDKACLVSTGPACVLCRELCRPAAWLTVL